MDATLHLPILAHGSTYGHLGRRKLGVAKAACKRERERASERARERKRERERERERERARARACEADLRSGMTVLWNSLAARCLLHSPTVREAQSRQTQTALHRGRREWRKASGTGCAHGRRGVLVARGSLSLSVI